jgi:hypothetical protein
MDAAVLESRRQNQAVTSAFGLQTAVGEVHPQALARPSRATQVVPVSSKNSRVLARGCATDSSTGWTGWALSERGNRTHQPQKQRRSRLGPGLLLVELRGLETPDPHCQCGICGGSRRHRAESLGSAGGELGAAGMSGREFMGQIEGQRLRPSAATGKPQLLMQITSSAE